MQYSVIEKKMDTYYSEILRIQRSFQDNQEYNSTLKACFTMKKEMDQLRDNLWMIEFLTIEAMIKRPNHFKDLFLECKLPIIEPNDEMNFN